MDLALIWDTKTDTADLRLSGADLQSESGLYSAVLISLFTDARAGADDERPDALDDDPGGWWGDVLAEIDGDRLGSKLWLLKRSKITAEVLRRAKDYATEALNWLIVDGVASVVTVTTEAVNQRTLGITVEVVRPDGTTQKFSYIWDVIDAL